VKLFALGFSVVVFGCAGAPPSGVPSSKIVVADLGTATTAPPPPVETAKPEVAASASAEAPPPTPMDPEARRIAIREAAEFGNLGVAATSAPYLPGGAGVGVGASGSKAGPVVSNGAPSVNGGLPPGIVERVLTQRVLTIRGCFKRALNHSPKIVGGGLRIQFVIDKDGSVTSVAVSSQGVLDPTLSKCLEGVFKQMKFPAPDSGIVTVNYPLTISP
jgi:hypothetical protein